MQIHFSGYQTREGGGANQVAIPARPTDKTDAVRASLAAQRSATQPSDPALIPASASRPRDPV
jgi:hypothetical protein